MEDLIDACSEALHEYEGIRKGVSRRTVQMDIQVMRSDKLGYNAPIIVIDKKFYTYADPNYSITNIPITDQDLNKMSEVVEILKQFKGFQHFTELSGIVQKLEDKIQSNKGDHRPIIDLEKNPLLRGLENIDIIYDAIAKKKQLEITYQSFKARQADRFNFHPMLLKEHRNRWFVLGQRKGDVFALLALDRMLDVEKSPLDVKPYDVDRILHYFDHVIGVTVNENQEPETIRIWVMRRHAPYVLTKPLHSSQRMVDQDPYGIIVEIDVVPNFELEKEILSFGDGMRVLSPNTVKRRIRSRLKGAIEGYQTDIHSEKLYHILGQLNAKGHVQIEKLFKEKILHDVGKGLRRFQNTSHLEVLKEGLFEKIPKTQNILEVRTFKKLLDQLEGYEIAQSAFYKVDQNSQLFKEWGQHYAEKSDRIIMRIFLTTEKRNSPFFAMLPGSHKKLFTQDEIELLTGNTNSSFAQGDLGQIHIMHPNLVHRIEYPRLNRQLSWLEFELVTRKVEA